MKKQIGLFLLLFAPLLHGDQPLPRVEMQVSPQDRRITIGGEVKIGVTVVHSTQSTVVPPTEPLWLEPFEFKRMTRGTVRKKGDELVESFTVVCTIFELGEFKIPKIPFYLPLTDGKTTEIFTDDIPITVVSVLDRSKDSAVMRPIKGPASIDRLLIYRSLLWPAILAALLTFLYLYLRHRARKQRLRDDLDEQLDATSEALTALRELRRRHKSVFERNLAEDKPAYHFEKPDMEPSEEAVVALLDLQNQRLISEGMIKQFHAELSHIFRHYVGRRYGFPTAEKTTSEVMALARYHGVPDAARELVESILGQCDLIKFSPMATDHEACEVLWRASWDFVMNTRPASRPALAVPKSRT
jgi:hypothetical protein